MSNLNNISEINEQLQSGFEGHMQALMANPQVQPAAQPDVLPEE